MRTGEEGTHCVYLHAATGAGAQARVARPGRQAGQAPRPPWHCHRARRRAAKGGRANRRGPRRANRRVRADVESAPRKRWGGGSADEASASREGKGQGRMGNSITTEAAVG